MRRLFNIFAISAIMVCFSCGQATNKQQEQQEQDVFAEFNKQLEQKEQQEQQEEDDYEKSLYGYWKDSNGIIELFLDADLMFCVVDKELIYRGGWSVNHTGGVDADLADAYNGGLYFTAINEGTYTSLTPAFINIKLRKDSSKKKISWSRTSNRTLADAIRVYNEKVTQLAREKENARSSQSTRKAVKFYSKYDVLDYISHHNFKTKDGEAFYKGDFTHKPVRVVKSFTETNAVVHEHPHAGSGVIVYYIDATTGVIGSSYGETYYLVK